MTLSRLAILLSFAALLGVPFIFRPAQPPPPAEALQLIVITPHNEQIRFEFAHGFDEWYLKRYGRRVNVIYNVPGGTSEIRKMLESQFIADLESGKQPGGNADIMFGGGSFEYNNLKKGVSVRVKDVERSSSILAQIDFSDDWLQETFGNNRIGDGPIYDPDRMWFGAAFSGFGIVYNRDALGALGIEDPQHWADLCNSKLRNNVALVNPNQSGSITTAFDAILKRSGWIRGWQILRRAGANARYFSGSSLKPPIDVTQGQAAMGVCIDFYGRFQSQATKEAGYPDRVGYIDPPDGSIVDVDPIAMLRNPPHADLAKRFIEFVMSEEGQALWQLPRRDAASTTGDQLGPLHFELRRLPVPRAMYQPKYFNQFIDKVNPYELATPLENNNPNFRDFIAPMFAAIAMDTHQELTRAWQAIVTHPGYPQSAGGAEVVEPTNVTDPTLRTMLELFDALPTVAGPNGATFSMAEVSALGEIRNGWLKEKWNDAGLWNPEATPGDEMRRQFGRFFRLNYQRIVDLAEESRP